MQIAQLTSFELSIDNKELERVVKVVEGIMNIEFKWVDRYREILPHPYSVMWEERTPEMLALLSAQIEFDPDVDEWWIIPDPLACSPFDVYTLLITFADPTKAMLFKASIW
jgi:hypothetical protein